MRDRVFRWVFMGDQMPWYMGAAWINYPRHCAACFILPLNWPARWVYTFMLWMRYPAPRNTLREANAHLSEEVQSLRVHTRIIETQNDNLRALNEELKAREAKVMAFIDGDRP